MTMIQKDRLYLGWRWSEVSEAVVGRYSGEAAIPNGLFSKKGTKENTNLARGNKFHK
jgi:hypothetical protein